jgi:CHAT domain-containing protein
MWSLDGAIRYLPIAALHDGKGYLVESYSNVVFTTASLTRLLDSSASKWRAIGLGVSKQHQNFIALTFVPAELRSIIREEGAANSAGVLPGIIRLDEQFTLQTMTEGLREGYPVVHIASHFVFLPGREKLSYLLLGDGSTLSLDEMEQSPGIFERVELLTLSACETALGANGKEVESLAFVAQDLGAKAVVASLWPVTDEGTQVLMREFYRLKKANPKWSKIDALRHAQISLLRGTKTGTRQIPKNSLQTRRNEEAKAPFAHPRYWAPFILIGNWK